MTDAKPVEVGEIVALLKTLGEQHSKASKMLADAKSARNIAAGDEGAYYSHLLPEQTPEHQAVALILALQAEVARLEELNEMILVMLERISAITKKQPGESCEESVKREIDRLTQENARLAGEAALLKDRIAAREFDDRQELPR